MKQEKALELDVLPWSVVNLGNGLLESVQPGFACGNHNSGGEGIVHVRPFNVTTDGQMDFSTVKSIPISEVTKPERLLRQGDVVFNNTNSPELVGKTAFYDDSRERAFSNHMTRLRVNSDKLRPEFLALTLHQLWREGYFADKCNNHVSQASISRTVLLETQVPLPSLAEQDRLVEVIFAAQEAVDHARDRLAAIPALLKKFRQSVLAAACTGQLTADWRERCTAVEPAERLLTRIREHRKNNSVSSIQAKGEDIPRDWALTSVGQVCAVATGATPLRTRSTYFGGDIPWITSSAVNDGIVTRASQFITELAVKETNAKVFPPGTLIVAMYGEGQTRGRVAELGISTATNQALAALLFDDVNEQCRTFVKLHFLKNYEEMRNLAAGGVQPNLSLGLIRDSKLLLPPVDEQAEIVQRVESLFALANSIESRLGEATAQVERTAQAILAKAFRGELT